MDSQTEVIDNNNTAYSDRICGAEAVLAHLRERLNEREYDNADEDNVAGYETALSDFFLIIEKFKAEERREQREDVQKSIAGEGDEPSDVNWGDQAGVVL